MFHIVECLRELIHGRVALAVNRAAKQEVCGIVKGEIEEERLQVDSLAVLLGDSFQ